MAQTEQKSYEVLDNLNDIDYSKPAKAKFLFHLFFLGFFIFIGGCAYALWSNKFYTTSNQEVPESTQYNPKYK
jgi:hypothetical protein